jgi:colanic acid/amylovoran biosynthesis glycosyltransferase
MSRRLALVVPAFPKTSETFIVNKFLGLLERGWDVHIVCQTSDPAEWARFSQLTGAMRSRVHVTWPVEPKWKAALLAPVAALACLAASPRRTAKYFREASRRVGVSGALARMYLDVPLLRLGPDIVHFEFGALAPERMDLAQLLDCRVTVSFRGYDINFVGLDRPNHFDPVWAGAAGLHFLGEDLWRRARRRGCPPDVFHTLIPPAIDIGFYRRDPGARREGESSSRPLRILSVGRLEWKKGYEDALVAVRRLVDRGIVCEYRIVGDGNDLPALAFIRSELRLEGIVEFVGALRREDVRREMESADVLLHAAVSEGFCNAVVEAQAMELPVVCTDADGLRENVADGETGFVVGRRNPAALAGKIEILARDPALRRRMGEAGRRRATSLFQLRDQIDRFDAFYSTIASPAAHVTRRERNVSEQTTERVASLPGAAK